MAHKVRPAPVSDSQSGDFGLLHNSLGEPYSIKLVYPTYRSGRGYPIHTMASLPERKDWPSKFAEVRSSSYM